MTTVFRNYNRNFNAPTKGNVIRQAHPNSASYIWEPNRSRATLNQPHEKGTFFQVKGLSGTGSAGGKK